MNANSTVDHHHSSFQAEYNESWMRFLLYDGTRCLQMLIGIIGNVMTLKIIKNLKFLKNGHILMAYLAISDIFVNFIAPLATLHAATRTFNFGMQYWKSLYIAKLCLYAIGTGFATASSCVMAVDRYVKGSFRMHGGLLLIDDQK